MFTNTQKNSLLNLIKERGLDARNFTLTVSPEPLELRLTYKPEKFYFRVNYRSVGKDGHGQDAMRLFTFSIPKPGLLLDLKSELQHTNVDKWDTVLAVAGHWLQLLKLEFTQPDLWAELEHAPDAFEGADLPEDAFTPAEIKLLEARAAVVEQEIINLDLPPDAEAAITKAVKEVPEKAKRLTKKEVGEILFSTVMREGLKALLSKENMIAVWHALYHLFTLAIEQ